MIKSRLLGTAELRHDVNEFTGHKRGVTVYKEFDARMNGLLII